jgi:drug/metabolite transporter (DMT)-like permease
LTELGAAAVPSPRSQLSGILGVLLAAASWGSWSLFLRPTGLPGSVTAPILLLGVFLVSLPLVSRDPTKPTWDRASVALLFAYAASNATNVAAFFSAMSTTSVAVAVLTHSVAPVLVAALAPIVDGTRAPRALPAAFLALAGLVLVLEPWRPEARTGDVALGAMLGLLSAVGYATCVFMLSRLALRIGAVRAMGYHSGIAAVLLLPLALGHLGEIEARDALPLGAAIVLPGVVAGLAFTHGLRVLGSARAAVLALFEPVVACTIGWAVLGEPLGPLAIVGGAMVVGAGALVAGDRSPAKTT